MGGEVDVNYSPVSRGIWAGARRLHVFRPRTIRSGPRHPPNTRLVSPMPVTSTTPETAQQTARDRHFHRDREGNIKPAVGDQHGNRGQDGGARTVAPEKAIDRQMPVQQEAERRGSDGA